MWRGLPLARSAMLATSTDSLSQRASLPERAGAHSNPGARSSLRLLLGHARQAQQADVEAPLLAPGRQAADGSAPGLPPGSGPAVLLGVALLWGTYGPVLKLLYSMPGSPDPAALTAARGLLQAGTLYLTGQLLGWHVSATQSSGGSGKSKLPLAGGGLVWRAGAELGFWNFLATSLQAAGLEHTTAVRAAFIVQATAILTPVLAALAGERPRASVWGGCALALASTLLITLDGKDPAAYAGSGAASLVSLGDTAIFGAAFFYSVATVRLGFYARQLPPISVAAAKSYALAAWAAAWLAWLTWQRAQAGQPMAELWEGVAQPHAWLLVAWSALGPGALAAFLQSQGQARVSPSQAQVYFSSTPVWSALLALALLGEAMGPLGWLGGGGIVLASLVASR